MSILIKSIENSNVRGRNVILFADLKSEVPSTGQETVALLNEKMKLNAGDVIYTAALEAAILDSNDEWDWSFGGGGGGGSENAVLYTEQTLTSEQQTQARSNIGAVSLSDIGTVPSASNVPAQALGTAAAGSSTDYARADHVHAMPSATDVGAAPAVIEEMVLAAGAVTQALDAGKIYHFIGRLTSLTLTLNATASGQLAQYHFDFVEGSTAFDPMFPNTVVLPDGWTWAADTRYEVDILNGYAVIVGWAVSA